MRVSTLPTSPFAPALLPALEQDDRPGPEVVLGLERLSDLVRHILRHRGLHEAEDDPAPHVVVVLEKRDGQVDKGFPVPGPAHAGTYRIGSPAAFVQPPPPNCPGASFRGRSS